MNSGTPGEPRFDVHIDLSRDSIKITVIIKILKCEQNTKLNNAYRFSGELRNGSLEICKGVI